MTLHSLGLNMLWYFHSYFNQHFVMCKNIQFGSFLTLSTRALVLPMQNCVRFLKLLRISKVILPQACLYLFEYISYGDSKYSHEIQQCNIFLLFCKLFEPVVCSRLLRGKHLITLHNHSFPHCQGIDWHFINYRWNIEICWNMALCNLTWYPQSNFLKWYIAHSTQYISMYFRQQQKSIDIVSVERRLESIYYRFVWRTLPCDFSSLTAFFNYRTNSSVL